MQQGNFINVFLARHVSGTYAHHQEQLDVELQHAVFCTEFLDGWWSCEPLCTVRMGHGCNSISNAHDDGHMYPKHVELRIHQ